jgi:hypothetical protein
MSLGEDLNEFLRTEELRACFERAKIEYFDQVVDLKAPRFRRAKKPEDRTLPPEAEELWGPDKSQWRVREEAVQRTLGKERLRGTPEDMIEELHTALTVWLERLADARVTVRSAGYLDPPCSHHRPSSRKLRFPSPFACRMAPHEPWLFSLRRGSFSQGREDG